MDEGAERAGLLGLMVLWLHGEEDRDNDERSVEGGPCLGPSIPSHLRLPNTRLESMGLQSPTQLRILLDGQEAICQRVQSVLTADN